MKIYFHLCIEEFTNCYIVCNDDPAVKQALIIDPGKISNEMIAQLEDGGYELKAVLITHNHTSHTKGLKTLQKIYSPTVYGADTDLPSKNIIELHGDGTLLLAGLKIEYFSVPGHTADSMAFKIGDVIFTGDTIFNGTIGETSSQYSKRTLINSIQQKILSQNNDCIIMSGHGPPTTVLAEKSFNIDLPQESMGQTNIENSTAV